MRKVYTTGDVAKLLNVAPRTVSKWFDSGRLKGYRIPGSQDRRIPRETLVTFLTEHGMALPPELAGEVCPDGLEGDYESAVRVDPATVKVGDRVAFSPYILGTVVAVGCQYGEIQWDKDTEPVESALASWRCLWWVNVPAVVAVAEAGPAWLAGLNVGG